jgi:hypothetical protein
MAAQSSVNRFCIAFKTRPAPRQSRRACRSVPSARASDENRATISLNVTETLFDLPVVGGKAALTRAGLEKVTPADVIETPASEADVEVEVTDLSDG